MISTQRTGWIGIDLGTRSLKLAQVDRIQGVFHLRQAVCLPRPTPWPRDETAMLRPQSSAELIQAAKSLGAQWKGRFAACVLPMQLSPIHNMDVPADCTADDLPRWVQTQLASQRDMAFDYWQVPAVAKSPQAGEVVAVTLKNAWAGQVPKDLQTAGLTCEILDAVPTALARAALLDTSLPAHEPVALVDWGYASILCCIAVNGTACFTRRFRAPGLGELLESLQESLGVDDEEATMLLQQYGFPEPGFAGREDGIARTVAELCKGHAEPILAECRRTWKYLQVHRKELCPREARLTGGGATIRHAAEYLAARGEMPVQCWRFSASDGDESSANCPPVLLAAAISLSALAWESR